MGLTAQYYGNPGNFDRFYWVTPTFPNALGAPIGPAQVKGVDPLDNNNCVVLKWDLVPGAVSYAVSYSQSLETRDSATFVTSTTGNSITDIGQTSNPVPSMPTLQGDIDAGSHDINNVQDLSVRAFLNVGTSTIYNRQPDVLVVKSPSVEMISLRETGGVAISTVPVPEPIEDYCQGVASYIGYINSDGNLQFYLNNPATNEVRVFELRAVKTFKKK